MLQDNEVGPSRSSGNSYTGSGGSNNTTVQSDSRPSRQPVQVERAPERKMETPKFVQENTPSIKAPERKMEAPKVAGDNASRPSKTPSPSASPKSNPTRKR